MKLNQGLRDSDAIIRLHYQSRLIGVCVGGLLAIGGIVIALCGMSGSVNWNLKLPGLSSSLSNASPGVVVLVCGILIVFWFRPSSKIEQEVNLSKETSKQKVSLFYDAGSFDVPERLALGNVVTFADKNLETAIRAALKKPGGDLFELELLSLTSLNLNQSDVTDLSGLELCRNLRIVAAEYNSISELAPLMQLRQLEVLSLNGNPIAKLPDGGADLSCLQFLPELRELYLGKAGVKYLAVLIYLKKLVRLGLGYNAIEDISPLVENINEGGLRSCEYVDLRMNPLSEESVHRHLPFLRSKGINVDFTTKDDIKKFSDELLRRAGSKDPDIPT